MPRLTELLAIANAAVPTLITAPKLFTDQVQNVESVVKGMDIFPERAQMKGNDDNI